MCAFFHLRKSVYFSSGAKVFLEFCKQLYRNGCGEKDVSVSRIEYIHINMYVGKRSYRGINSIL